MFIVYLFLSLHFLEISPKVLPSYIEKCSKSDPNLNKCLEKSSVDASRKMKDGNRDLGVPPLEPFFIEKVDLGKRESGGTSLHQIYKNMKIYGITNITLHSSEADLGDNCYWNFKAKLPKIHMECDYNTTGKLLVFPINGHGKGVVDLYEVDCNYKATCEHYTKKNKPYLRLTDFKFDMNPKDIGVDFENIIDGNEELSKEVIKYINENSKQIFADIVGPINEVFGVIWKETINQVFSRVPEDELFLP